MPGRPPDPRSPTPGSDEDSRSAPQSLFWEAVPAAEAAADQPPTDPALADALWGAAAAHAFTGRLTPATAELLRTPWQSALRPHTVVTGPSHLCAQGA